MTMGIQSSKCRIVEVPSFKDNRGTLAVVEGPTTLPFQAKRFYYIYGAEGASRACHAHRTEEELVFALAGTFTVRVDDGETSHEFHLHRPDRALYIPPLLWHEVHSFSSGAVCAVLASQRYDATDYFQDYEEFRKAVHRI